MPLRFPVLPAESRQDVCISSKVFTALFQVLQETLQSLKQYTHVAFTSRNGIQAVLDALGASTCDNRAAAGLLNSPSIQCCALGADAELLYQAGVSNVLMPQEVSNDALSCQRA